MKTIKINDIDYPIDSSGAIPENYDYGIIWKLNKQWHRIDGPAVEWKNGRKDWWYRGQCLGYSEDGYTQEDFEQYVYLLKHPELKAFQ